MRPAIGHNAVDHLRLLVDLHRKHTLITVFIALFFNRRGEQSIDLVNAVRNKIGHAQQHRRSNAALVQTFDNMHEIGGHRIGAVGVHQTNMAVFQNADKPATPA